MIVVIRDENGNEEDSSIPLWAALTVIVLVSIVIFIVIPGQPLIATGVIFLFSILFLFGVLSEKKIIFDKGIKSIIIERRTINKKLKLEWKENKKIKFSNIKGIYVIEHLESDGMGDDVRYNTTEVIVFEGNSKRIWDDGTSEITNESSISLYPSDRDPESAKKFAISLCKAIGTPGYYIDENKKSIPLIETT